MPDRIGNAALIWSATSDASGQRVHLLQAPLRAIKAGHSMQTFQRQSLDRSVLENVAIGDGSAELRGRVRYDHDPVGLSDAIVAGSQGKTLRYIPDLSDPDVDFQCDLVAPLAPFGLELDQQRGILGDQSVELVLRLTDQGSFDPLYHGSAVLFSYRAGGSLEASSSFGRVTSSSAPATFADIDAGGGFGSLSTALSNQARIHWMSTASSVGPRTFPTLLLEDSRENLIDESEDFGSTGTWAPSTEPALGLTSGQADPFGGTNAYRLIAAATSSLSFIDGSLVAASSGDIAVSIFLQFDDSTTVEIQFRTAGGTLKHAVEVDWSSGIPDATTQTGSSAGQIFSEERWRDDWWRIGFIAPADSSGDHVMRIFPAGGSITTGGVFVFGASVEP